MLGHAIVEQPTPRPFHDRKGLLFVGAIHEERSPNGDSVLWFIEKIFPLIRARLGDDVTYTVAGVNNSERIAAMAGGPIRFVGRVDDLTPLYDESRVFVAPTRFAAGIPHKVHEAAARGVPFAVTSLLARQLGWNDGVEVLVADDPAGFAARCVDLYTNAALWKRLRKAALGRVRLECSTYAFESTVKEILSFNPRRLELLST